MKVPRTILLLALAAHAGTAQSQEIGDTQRGLAYVQGVCAECHAVVPSQRASPVATAPAFRSIAYTPGMTATALVVWFRTPHPTMPNLMIGGEDMDNVIAYILSLRDRR